MAETQFDEKRIMAAEESIADAQNLPVFTGAQELDTDSDGKPVEHVTIENTGAPIHGVSACGIDILKIFYLTGKVSLLAIISTGPSMLQ